MCRSIRTLRDAEPPGDAEVRAAALQFVRKVSGYRTPSATNRDVFDRAVAEITESVGRLMDGLVTPPGARPPAMARSRVVAREKADARSSARAQDL